MLNDTMINNPSKPENSHIVKYESIIIDAIRSRAFYFGNDMSKFKRRNRLCKCGCEKEVKWCKIYRRWNKYIFGHSFRTEKFFREPGKNPPLCKCGCGNNVNWDKNKKIWKVFLSGHNRRSISLSKKHKRKISKSLLSKKIKRSAETKRKISIGNTGKKRTKEIRLQLSLSHTGKKLSEKHKRKIGLASLGKKHSLETLLKLSGPNSHLWKGGISNEEYCDVWIDKDYKQDILARDNHTCQNPKCKGKYNHLSLCRHHINYDKQNCGPENLISLCRSCHGQANFNRKYWTEFYRIIIKEKVWISVE